MTFVVKLSTRYKYFSDAFVWLISKKGDAICSNQSESCQSLDDVIKLSNNGDVIMLQSGEQTEFCGEEEKISKSLTFRATTESQAKLSVAANCSVLFSMQDSTIIFEKIIFVHGYVTAVDSHLTFESCVLDDFVLYGMDDKFVGYYLSQSKITTVWDIAFIFQKECNFVSVTFYYSVWTFLEDPDVILSDMPRNNGLQVFCNTADLDVIDSFMADKQIYIRVKTDFKMNMRNTTFDGTYSKSVMPGGLNLDLGEYPVMIINNCTFRALKYSDLGILASMEYDRKFDRAGAIALKLIGITSLDKGKWWYHPGFKQLIITNCLFKSNQRALDVIGSKNVYVQIENSTFDGNEVLNEGGAIRIIDKDLAQFRMSGSLIVIKCVFLHNKAGVNPFNMTVINMNKQLTYDSKANVTEFEINPQKIHIFMFNIYRSQHQLEATTLKVSRVITFNLKGKGGAIIIQTMVDYDLVLQNCTFSNNIATADGGSIYGNEHGVITIQDSFVHGAMEAHQVVQGDLIFGLGSIKLEDSTFSGRFAAKAVSMIYFKHDGSDSFKLTNMAFACPTGSKLDYENITSVSDKEIDFIIDPWKTAGILKFSTFIYRCHPCDNNLYTYDHSIVTIKQLNQSEMEPYSENNILKATLKAHNIDMHQPKCHECPYGGFCYQSKVGALPNYWGWNKDDKVMFHPCPFDYCCANTDGCAEYDACAANRHGTLCGRCKPGFSEATFSVKCIPNSECNDKWVIYFTIFLALVYSLFLLFQDDLKNFLYSAPIGRATMLQNLKYRKSTVTAIQAFTSNIKSKNKSEFVLGITQVKPQDSGNSSDEGGIFIILLFYYFQDASIIHFKTIFVDADPPYLVLIRDIVGGLFNFRIDVMQFAENVCIHADLTPVSISLIKLLFVPTVLLILLLIYFIGKKLQKKLPSKWSNLAAKASGAIVLACLFSFQRLSQTFFSLVSCSLVMDSRVLFIDGTINCYNLHQQIAMLYIMICIVPFAIYIAVIPSFLSSGEVSFESFFLGCIIPLPWLIMFGLRRLLFGQRNGAISNGTCCDQVYKILQGPYRDYRMKLFPISICWSGVLLMRRLCLILAHSFIDDVTRRLSFMFVVCFMAFVHHNMARPCKESRANIAGTISNSALLLVCAINWVRATYESNGTVPKGPNAQLIDIFNSVEQVLLLWIPLVAAIFLVLFLLFRVTMKMMNCLTKRCQKSQPEAKKDSAVEP